MFAILSQLFFFLALSVIIFLIVRKKPEAINELDLDSEKSLEVQIENQIGKTFLKIPWEKIDTAFETFLEKILRRLHIWTLKIDAFLQNKLETLKIKNKEKTSFIEEANNHSLADQEKTEEVVDLSSIDLENLEKSENTLNEQNNEILEIEEVLEKETMEDRVDAEETKSKGKKAKRKNQ